MDRNIHINCNKIAWYYVALRKESVDRNSQRLDLCDNGFFVALRKESVDRNSTQSQLLLIGEKSLSARRAWIEMPVSGSHFGTLGASLSARRAWIEILDCPYA